MSNPQNENETNVDPSDKARKVGLGKAARQWTESDRRFRQRPATTTEEIGQQSQRGILGRARLRPLRHRLTLD